MSPKLQRVVEKFESLLTNDTPWAMGEKREVASWATTLFQTVESSVLETALKSPEQKIQKIHNSTVGKKRSWPDIHGGYYKLESGLHS